MNSLFGRTPSPLFETNKPQQQMEQVCEAQICASSKLEMNHPLSTISSGDATTPALVFSFICPFVKVQVREKPSFLYWTNIILDQYYWCGSHCRPERRNLYPNCLLLATPLPLLLLPTVCYLANVGLLFSWRA